MTGKAQNWFKEEIIWEKNSDPEYPFVADFKGEKCVIRLNDFPAENLYTLIVDDKEIADFDDWPESWSQVQQKPVAAD